MFIQGLASLVCLLIEDIFVLLKITMMAEYIFIGGTVAGLLWLRKKNPYIERPIKVMLLSNNLNLF